MVKMTQNTTDQTQDNEHIKHEGNSLDQPIRLWSWLGRGITHTSKRQVRQSRVTVTEDAAAVLAKYKQVTGNDGASRRQGAL